MAQQVFKAFTGIQVLKVYKVIGAGAQGLQGDQGVQGNTGSAGSFGGVTFDYTYSTNTINNDPGTGELKFNNTTSHQQLLCLLMIEMITLYCIEPFLRTIDDSTSPIKGHFKITKKDTPETIPNLYNCFSYLKSSGFFTVTCALCKW